MKEKTRQAEPISTFLRSQFGDISVSREHIEELYRDFYERHLSDLNPDSDQSRLHLEEGTLEIFAGSSATIIIDAVEETEVTILRRDAN